MSTDLLHRQALANLRPSAALLAEMGTRFTQAGHEIALVGGPVRDALLGHSGPADLDFATSARPDDVERILAGFAETTWDLGIAFGTVGARIAGRECEITTYRSEQYDPTSRKPDVAFGTTLSGDLGRRDFTVNAMALRLPDFIFVDEHGGVEDLAARRLRTPSAPEESFADDPLRMMRAARFASQLDFEIDPTVLVAMTAMADRIDIVSAERIRDELCKLVMTSRPRIGLTALVDTGIAERVLPELPLLRLEVDEHHRHKDVYEHSLIVLEQSIALEQAHEPASEPDLVLRLAALLHDIGKPRTRKFEADGGVSFHHHEVVGARMTRKRMQALRFSNDVTEQVSRLVELHLRFHGYGTGAWTDAAVRRYVRDAGDQLVQLHKLTRADCTTRNRKRAANLQRAYDSLEARIEQLAAQEELNAIRPDLDGTAIMQILGIGPGPEVGAAYRFLLDLRLDRGPLEPDQAKDALLAWWAARG